MAPIENVDDYIAAQPEAVRPALESIRVALRKALPQAEEFISYKMPAYRTRDGVIVYFAGWKAHVSLYPITPDVADGFAEELTPYEQSKGTVRFPLSQKPPLKLIVRLAKARLAAVEARAAQKKAARKTAAKKRAQ